MLLNDRNVLCLRLNSLHPRQADRSHFDAYRILAVFG